MKKIYTNKTIYNNHTKPEWLIDGKVEWYAWNQSFNTSSFQNKDIDYWLNLGLIYWQKPDAWILK